MTIVRDQNLPGLIILPLYVGLHLAIAYNNDEIAQAILECGVDIHIRARGMINTFFVKISYLFTFIIDKHFHFLRYIFPSTRSTA